MAQTLTIDFAQPMPLFPLPHCVLLPHATIPLHIFEPRYRTMVRDALRGNRLIAMACFEGEEWKLDYEGAPQVRPFVCVGYIVREERLADGRFNILLQGVCRARIVEEVEEDPYRTALLAPIEHQPMEIDLGECRDRLEKLLADQLLSELAAVSAIHNWLSDEIPTVALIDLATMHLAERNDERYAMLAEPDADARAQWLERLLRRTRETLAIAARYPEKKPEDHIYLN